MNDKEFRLNPVQARKLWVSALKGGYYKQTVGYLHTKKDGQDKFCCLGVACELYKELEGNINCEEQQNEDQTVIGYGPLEGYISTQILPPLVQNWLGLESDAGIFQGNELENSLVDLNDSGFSFKEIADVIEKEPEGLCITT